VLFLLWICQSRIRLLCPHCGSDAVEKKPVLEHTPCGYVASIDAFQKEEELVCPGCHLKLKTLGLDYKKQTTWFLCSRCTNRFQDPVMRLPCRSCGNELAIKNIDLIDSYEYSLVPGEWLKSIISIDVVLTVLKEYNYQVMSPGFVQGGSGAVHRVDVLATKDERKVVVNIFSSPALVGMHDVVNTLAVKLDFEPSDFIMIANPGLDPAAHNLSKMYGITVIEADSHGKLTEALKAEMKRID